MTHRIIMAGFGGQGILFMGRLLAEAGLFEGREVSWLPSYGPEMRGGTANCQVVVSPEPVASPVVIRATALAAMNLPSLERFEEAVTPGGVVVINRSLVDKGCSREDVLAVEVPASEIADELGAPAAANMVALGALVEAAGVVAVQSLLEVLDEAISQRRRHLLEVNREAVRRGSREAAKLQANWTAAR